MAEQVDALYNSGLSVNTVITALTLKRGKALSVNEIKAIATRYNQNAGRLVTPNGQVIKNTEHQSTASESRGATQSGGKGKVEGAEKGTGKGSPLPVTEPIKAKNGLNYESNPKHTPGGQGFRPNAGIEPKDSLNLFENSIPTKHPHVRLSIDKDGNIHRFFNNSKDGSGAFHWSGSTADKGNALGHRELAPYSKEIKQLKGKK
jgi:hypothetical protein